MREDSPFDNDDDQISNVLSNRHLSYSDNDELPEELVALIKELEKTFALVPEPNESRMHANRSRFLTLSASPRQQASKKMWFSSFWQRLLWQSAVLLLLLLMSLFTIRIVSANSLPGEQWYLIKLSMERLVYY